MGEMEFTNAKQTLINHVLDVSRFLCMNLITFCIHPKWTNTHFTGIVRHFFKFYFLFTNIDTNRWTQRKLYYIYIFAMFFITFFLFIYWLGIVDIFKSAGSVLKMYLNTILKCIHAGCKIFILLRKCFGFFLVTILNGVIRIYLCLRPKLKITLIGDHKQLKPKMRTCFS